MAPGTDQHRGIDQSLMKVVAHPIRVRALSVLMERTASAKEIATELNTPMGNISYHVRELEQVGLIELTGEKKRRGAVERFYRAVPRPLLSDEDMEKRSHEERESISVGTVQLIVADVTEALNSGSLAARSDTHMTRVPMLLDEEGWEQLIEIQANALRAIFDLQAASAQRLDEGDGEAGIPVTAAMMCFPTPPKRGPN